MNQHFFRGQLLLEQGRFDLAANEFRQAVTLEPDDPSAHSMLGLALLRSGRVQEALRSVETALEKDPGFEYAHWTMALVRVERNELKLAEASIRQAIELDPQSAPSHGLLARILCEGKRNEEALAAANAGLAIDAADDLSLTYRARALMALGRKGEAEQVAHKLLADSPEDAWNHCLRGDQLLIQGDPAAARVHYLEALRLDPRNGYARNGLATSLKARSPIYGIILRFFLSVQKLRSGAIWVAIIALVFGMHFGDNFVSRHPDLMVPYEGLKALFWAALILVILANPIFDLLLRFDPEGRHALSPDEIKATNWYLPCLAFGALCAAWVWFGRGSNLPRGMGFAAFFLCTAVTQVFEATPGFVRKWMGIFTAIAGACLVLTPVLVFVGALLILGKHGALGIRLILVTIWLPVIVMLYTAFSEEIRAWLEKRRPDADGHSW